MKVILLEDVKKIGKKGDVVEVKDGYAKNCLFPKKLAQKATNQTLTELSNQKSALTHEQEVKEKEAKEILKIIDGKSIQITKLGAEKLFGSVTNSEIAQKIKEVFGKEIDKHKVKMSEDINTFGTYDFTVKVYPNIVASMTVEVIPEKK